MDVTALVLLLIAVPPVVGPVVGVTLPSPRALLIGLATAFVALALIAAGLRRWQRRRGPGARAEGVASHVASFVRGMSSLRHHRILAQALGWAIVSWGTRVVVVWLMLPAFGLHWPVMQAAMCLLIINLSIAVVGTPGNVGTFELAAVGALRLFGATPEVAMSFAVVLHLAEVVPSALLGALAIWKFGLRLQTIPSAGEGA
jgi:uncharacterized protein (TIRG00374 family)